MQPSSNIVCCWRKENYRFLRLRKKNSCLLEEKEDLRMFSNETRGSESQ